VSVDRLLAQIAERQHGLVTLGQAIAGGLSPDQIHRRCRAGRLEQLRRGVYAIAGAPRTQQQAWLAAVLAAGDAAVLSHASAASLWKLRPAPDADGIHVATPLDQRVRLAGVIHHRSGLLVPVDVTVHERIPTSTVARTIAEIGGQLGPVLTGRCLDDAIRRRLVTLEEVRACHARLSGPGRRRLRDLKAELRTRLPGYDPGGSDLEIRALTAIGRAGLRLPVQQHRVRIEGRTRFIDLAYPDVLLAIELGGWNWHGSRSARKDDLTRTRQLQRAGWTVVEFAEDDSDDELVHTVATLLVRLAA
jgi:hypothetical protein